MTDLMKFHPFRMKLDATIHGEVCQHSASSILMSAPQTILFEPLVVLEQLDHLSFQANWLDFCVQKNLFPFLNQHHAQHLSFDMIFSYCDISLSVRRCRNASEKKDVPELFPCE